MREDDYKNVVIKKIIWEQFFFSLHPLFVCFLWEQEATKREREQEREKERKRALFLPSLISPLVFFFRFFNTLN